MDYIAKVPRDQDGGPVENKTFTARSAEEAYKLASWELRDWLGDEIHSYPWPCYDLSCDLMICDEDGEVRESGTVTHYLSICCDRCEHPKDVHTPALEGWEECDHFEERCEDNPFAWNEDCLCYKCRDKVRERVAERGESLEIAKEEGGYVVYCR